MSRYLPFRKVVLPTTLEDVTPVAPAIRLPGYVGCKVDAAATLKALKVFFVGAGSVGGRMVTHCARLGISTCWITDHKGFKAASVFTHEAGPQQIGEPKASSTAQLCKQISPGTSVYAFDGSFEDLPQDAIAETDLVVMATDNLPAELAVGQQCLHWGKPLLHASVHGETLLAQVRFFGNTDAQGPCPACAFGPEEWAHLDRQSEFSCEGFEPAKLKPRITDQPTRSASFSCATAADLGMSQIIRLALGLGESVLDTMIEFCGYRNSLVTSRLMRRANCPCDHTLFAPMPLPRPLGECSLNCLIAVAGFKRSSVTFTLGDFEWVEFGVCACAQPGPVRRFVQMGQTDLGRCATCGTPIHAQPFSTRGAVPAHLLEQWMARPLREVRPVRWVVVRDGNKAALFRSPHDGEAS
jgi:molybdopterin/thiamine biosynthesis adenylyltransferase